MADETRNTAGSTPKVVSLGCRLNLAEGELIGRAGEEAGLSDAIIINTCGVTNEAVRQSKQAARRARKDNPKAKVLVTGCAAQIDPAAFAEMPDVDGVLGNDVKHRSDAWAEFRSERPEDEPIVRINDIMSVRQTAPQLVDAYGDRARAFLQIQNGCDHRCTFCIIPFGRGNSRSCSTLEVVEQARKLTANGHCELVLTGVDITSWGADLPGSPVLGDLVQALLSDVPQMSRLRLSSIDGAEIDPLLKRLICEDSHIAPHIHLSAQSGDDLILKRMKRRHTRQDIINLCMELRRERPDIAFGADLIAGFPTETDAMFEQSLALIEDASLNYLHVFPYSSRQGTPAARMPQVNGAIIKERAKRLRSQGEKATRRFLEKLVGGTYSGVIETGARVRLGNFALVELDERPPSEHQKIGSMVDVRIESFDGAKLLGSISSKKGASH